MVLKVQFCKRDGGTTIAQFLFEMPPTAEFCLVRAARPGVHDPTFLSLNYIIFCYPSSRSSFCSVLCQSFYICSISNPLEYFTRYSRSGCTLILPLSKLQVIVPFSGSMKIFSYWQETSHRKRAMFFPQSSICDPPTLLLFRAGSARVLPGFLATAFPNPQRSRPQSHCYFLSFWRKAE